MTTIVTLLVLMLSGFCVYGVYRVFFVGSVQTKQVESRFVRWTISLFMTIGLAAITLSTLVGVLRIIRAADPTLVHNTTAFMLIIVGWCASIFLGFGWANIKSRREQNGTPA